MANLTQEVLTTLAKVWMDYTKPKLQSFRNRTQITKGRVQSRLLDLTMHETDPEQYELRKKQWIEQIDEYNKKIQVMDLILKKK